MLFTRGRRRSKAQRTVLVPFPHFEVPVSIKPFRKTESVNEYGNIIAQLTNNDVYDAEAVISPDGKKILYTSRESGDLDIYIMNIDGTNKKQLTHELGYDGGGFFSPDSKKIVFRAYRPKTDKEIATYNYSLEHDLVAPDGMELYVMNVDGSDQRPVFKTPLGQVSFAPYYHPDNRRIIFRLILGQVPVMALMRYWKRQKRRNCERIVFQRSRLSYDDSKLTLQATGYGTACDQIYELDLNKDPRDQIMRRISTGLGSTTCSFFYKEPDNDRRLYAGNFWALNATTFKNVRNTCPAKKCANPATITDPALKQLCNTSYTWDVFPDYDVFLVNKYGNIIEQLTDEPGYDAEAVLSPDGKTIAFTSIRSGDLELYTMNTDGTNVKQKLLEYNLVEPVLMELYVVDVDGSNLRQITNLSVASWAPYYLADNKRIVFSSNYNASGNGFGAFALFVINDDGTGLERITYGNEYQFNSFPMMNHAGTKLVWGSSRNGSSMFDLNLFLADWTDEDSASVNAAFSLLLVPLLILKFL
ncbi:WD40-like protein [Teladorsagia circumcincta]|uniref:WD40-like protein n=1 Tax=Teladorsagia circumcincta TaxID=45464 RepID=A0A2G9V0F9_TELCI|nr:WD40-like protein [Teladorsagia circumcincta]